MIIYIDENIPRHIAESFQILQQPESVRGGNTVEVKYIPSTFSTGTKDNEWIPTVSRQTACVIMKDLHINRRKHELEMYRQCGVGIFFLKGHSKKKSLNTWETVQALAKQWPEICRIACEEAPPFGYEFSLKGRLRKVS